MDYSQLFFPSELMYKNPRMRKIMEKRNGGYCVKRNIPKGYEGEAMVAERNMDIPVCGATPKQPKVDMTKLSSSPHTTSLLSDSTTSGSLLGIEYKN